MALGKLSQLIEIASNQGFFLRATSPSPAAVIGSCIVFGYTLLKTQAGRAGVVAPV